MRSFAPPRRGSNATTDRPPVLPVALVLLVGAMGPAPASAEPVDNPGVARDTVVRWNEALSRHEVAALEALYAPRVELYGHVVGRGQALSQKLEALAGDPRYGQAIDELDLVARPDGTVTALFLKSWTGRKPGSTRARLELAPCDSNATGWRITLETDQASEERAARVAAAAHPRCEQVADDAVTSLPRVKKLIERTLKSLPAGARFGGIGPDEEPGGGLSASLGVQTDERFEALVIYAVDPSGTLSVTVGSEALSVPKPVLARVRATCGRAPSAGH